MRYAYADENGNTTFAWDGRKSLTAAFGNGVKRMAWQGRFAEVVRYVKDTKTGKLFSIPPHSQRTP